MSNSFGKVDSYFKKAIIDGNEERRILMKKNIELSQEVRLLRDESVDDVLIHDAYDWALVKRPSGRSVYYIMYDKVSGTNVRVAYHDDAHVLRDMLKIMREDMIDNDKQRRLLDSQGIFD
tara:strand:- start:264 stop:623 length:360 start_codon:yes stop_codon:yes gene_type:complete